MAKMRRDFTYIDDVTRVILRLIDFAPRDDGGEGRQRAPGADLTMSANHRPEELMHVVVGSGKRKLGLKAAKEMLPMQPGDVVETFADIGELMRDTGFCAADVRSKTVFANSLRGYRGHYKVLTAKNSRLDGQDELFH